MAIYKTAVCFREGELGSVGNSRKPIDPRRVLRPPSGKELARRSGGPRTVADWKRKNWGTEALVDFSVHGNTVRFFSEGCPAPLIRELLEGPALAAVSVSGDDVRGWTEAESWRGIEAALQNRDSLRGEGLWDFLQGQIRFSVQAPPGSGKRLRRGQMVGVCAPWGETTLQRDLWGGPRADFVFDDTEPLDDVIAARWRDLLLWIDLVFESENDSPIDELAKPASL